MRGQQGLLIVPAVLALGAAGWLGWALLHSEDAAPASVDPVRPSPPAAMPRPRPAPVPPTAAPAAPPVSPEPDEPAVEERVVSGWREAILNQDVAALEQFRDALGQLGDEAVPLLVRQATADPEERARAWAVRELGRRGRTEQVGLFRGALADPSEYVRFNAAWALGEIGDRASSADLERLAGSDPSEQVRQGAREALARLSP